MIKNHIKELALVILVIFTLSSFRFENEVSGRNYSGYTKHPKCEMMKSTLQLNADKTFTYLRRCERNPKLKNVNSQTGTWKEVNDSTLSLYQNNIKRYTVIVHSSKELKLFKSGDEKWRVTLKREQD